MNRTNMLIRVLPIPTILLAGCSDFAGWGPRQEPGPVVAEQPPEVESPGLDEQPPDPHQDETIDQVLAFVDRLNGAGQVGPADETVEATASPSAPAAEPVGTIARVNLPLDVNDAGPPAPEPAQPKTPPPPAPPVIEAVFIPVLAGEELAPEDAPPTQATNSPLSAIDPPRSSMSLDELMAALGERTREHPQDLAAWWQLRLLQLAVGDDEAARKSPAEDVGPHAQLFEQLIEVIVATRQALEHPVVASETALAAVEALRAPLQERTCRPAPWPPDRPTGPSCTSRSRTSCRKRPVTGTSAPFCRTRSRC